MESISGGWEPRAWLAEKSSSPTIPVGSPPTRQLPVEQHPTLFGGSGTTVIACEKTARKGRLIELDPKYVDVIVKRWQDLVHQQAVLEADGRAFDEIAAERLAVAV